MKTNLSGKIAVFVLAFSASYSFAAETILPAVSNISLSREFTCGTRPETPNGCVTPISATFEMMSTGTCDVVSAEVIADSNHSTALLVIKKSRVPNCTRPEHAPALEKFVRPATATLKSGAPIYLANPISAN